MLTPRTYNNVNTSQMLRWQDIRRLDLCVLRSHFHLLPTWGWRWKRHYFRITLKRHLMWIQVRLTTTIVHNLQVLRPNILLVWRNLERASSKLRTVIKPFVRTLQVGSLLNIDWVPKNEGSFQGRSRDTWSGASCKPTAEADGLIGMHKGGTPSSMAEYFPIQSLGPRDHAKNLLA